MTAFETPERQRERRRQRVEVFGTLGGFALVASLLGVSVATAEGQDTPYGSVTYTLEDVLEYQNMLETLAAKPPQTSERLGECADNDTITGPFEAQHYAGESGEAEITDYIKDTYTIDVSLLNEAITVEDTFQLTPATPDVPRRNKDMSDLLKALGQFDAEMVKAATIENIVFVKNIRQTSQSDEEYSGLYSTATNTIYLTGYSYKTVLHEIAHAIDYRVFCNSEADFTEDEQFAMLNGEVPYGSEVLARQTDIASRDVLFTSEYAATNVVEDRAETLSKAMFYQMIFPGDDAWGSPLQQKQQELLIRYEAASPGFVAHVFSQYVK